MRVIFFVFIYPLYILFEFFYILLGTGLADEDYHYLVLSIFNLISLSLVSLFVKLLCKEKKFKDSILLGLLFIINIGILIFSVVIHFSGISFKFPDGGDETKAYFYLKIFIVIEIIKFMIFFRGFHKLFSKNTDLLSSEQR